MKFQLDSLKPRIFPSTASPSTARATPFFLPPNRRRVEMSIECHQVSRQAAFEGLSLPHQFYSPFLGVAGQ